MARMRVARQVSQSAVADKRAAIRFLKKQVRRSELRLRLNKQNAAMHKYNIKWNNRLNALSNISYAIAETALVTALTAGSVGWFQGAFVRWAEVRADCFFWEHVFVVGAVVFVVCTFVRSFVRSSGWLPTAVRSFVRSPGWLDVQLYS